MFISLSKPPADLIAKFKGKEGPGLKNPTYAAQIEATDRAIGRVIDEIDRLRLTDNTLVIFTSDNGGWEGATDNRPLRSGKGDLYEGGLRVPLIICWPNLGLPLGSTIDAPVISMDLAATIIDAAKIKLRPGIRLMAHHCDHFYSDKNLIVIPFTFIIRITPGIALIVRVGLFALARINLSAVMMIILWNFTIYQTTLVKSKT